jgi:hypothetical protein
VQFLSCYEGFAEDYYHFGRVVNESPLPSRCRCVYIYVCLFIFILVPVYQIVWQHIPESSNLHHHCRENRVFLKGRAWNKTKFSYLSHSVTLGTWSIVTWLMYPRCSLCSGMVSSGMLRRVALVRNDVSEELSASFISSSQRASVASYS